VLSFPEKKIKSLKNMSSSSKSSGGSNNIFKTAELGIENFITQLIRHEGMRSLAITFVCLIIVVILAVIVFRKLFFASDAGSASSGKPSSKAQIDAQRQHYQDLLGHIRALEALRHERELLSRRILRVVQSWQKKDENRTAAPGATSEQVDDLADQMRIMKREHQLLSMNCVAALGERDTAGVFRQDQQNQVWQKALAQAQRDIETKERFMNIEEIEAEDAEEVRKIEEVLNKTKTN
jgi:hypothetical protein